MKRNKGKIGLCLILILSIFTIGVNTYAHSGKTDSSGGHKDNKNKSGLGSYHYHCGGHPAHLHPNGICPYSSNKGATSSSSASSSSSSNKTTTISATKVEIEKNEEEIEEGKTITLKATITPDNTTNKTVTWKSSNENIAIVDEDGVVTAKKAGSVDISVTTSNGKKDTITISVKEEPKEEIATVEAVAMEISSSSNASKNTVTKDSLSDNDAIYGAITATALGGGGYWAYRKRKKK